MDGLKSKLCRAEKKLANHTLGEKKISWKKEKSKNDIWDTVKYPAYRNLEPQNDRIKKIGAEAIQEDTVAEKIPKLSKNIKP